jgi:hypothetical protein
MIKRETVAGAAGTAMGAYAGWTESKGQALPVRLAAGLAGAALGGAVGVGAAKVIRVGERVVGGVATYAGRQIADAGSRTGNFQKVLTGVTLQAAGEASIRSSRK